MTTEKDTADLVRQVLCENMPNVRTQFIDALADPLDIFVLAMASVLKASGEFDKFASGNEDREKVAWLIFSAVQGHLIAMRLFLDGFLVQSGNAQRQVLESIAMALLFSKPSLGYLQRFNDDKYSSNNSIRDVIRNTDKLGVNKDAVNAIRDGAVFYDDFSHPSKMTITLYSSLAEPEASNIGGMFDPAKLEQYKIEANSRVKIAKIIPGFISGVRRNLETDS